jgi:hypothetical protein
VATVSIRESGIPRLYRTAWLKSEIGPDSGTLASKLASALSGLGQGSDIAPSLFATYTQTVNDALARVRRQELTSEAANAIEQTAWDTYVAAVEDESARLEEDAFDFYIEMERIAFEKHQLPGTTDRVKPEEFDAYERERDAAYAVYEEAVATAQSMRDEATAHARTDRIVIVTAQRSTWIWGALLVGGIGIAGIWALSRGRIRARA